MARGGSQCRLPFTIAYETSCTIWPDYHRYTVSLRIPSDFSYSIRIMAVELLSTTIQSKSDKHGTFFFDMDDN